MVNLFMPYTPYHLLLSFAIALSMPGELHYLILGESSPGNLKVFRLLQEIYASAGITAYEMEGTFRKSNLKKFLIKQRNISRVDTLFKELPAIDRFFYFCDCHVVTTYSAFLARKENPGIEFFFVEDGVGSYISSPRTSKNGVEKIADRLLFGKWHTDTVVPGSFMESTGAWALFPDFLPSFFDEKKKFAVSREKLLSEFDRGLFSQKSGSLPDTARSLVAVDFEHYTETDAYRDAVSSYIRRAEALGGNSVLKLHPSDRRQHVFYGADNIFTLPSHLPVEVFYLFYGDSLRFVVGGLTTALLTAKWLVPDAEVVSIIPQSIVQSVHNAQEIFSVFSACGIKVCTL